MDLFLHFPICHCGVHGDYFHFTADITNSAPFRQAFDQNFFPHERHNSIEGKQTCVQCNTCCGIIRCANTEVCKHSFVMKTGGGGIDDFGVGVEEDIKTSLKINRV